MLMTKDAISPEYLEEIVDAFNRQDADAIANYFAEDGEFLLARGSEPFGARLVGRKQIRDYIAERFKQIPDMRWENSQSWVSGNKGLSEWTVLGTSVTGERIHWLGCDTWEFENGKIKRKNTYWKCVQPA
jgi:uncharacterized protein (TIGR02246 family)